MRKGLDQTTAWILATLIAGAVFTTVLAITIKLGKNQEEADGLGEGAVKVAPHADEHGEAPADAHGDAHEAPDKPAHAEMPSAAKEVKADEPAPHGEAPAKAAHH